MSRLLHLLVRRASAAWLSAALASVLLTPAAASAAPAIGCPVATSDAAPLTASAERRGWIDLRVEAAPRSVITVGECSYNARTPIQTRTASEQVTSFDDAALWTCHRIYRKFYAVIRAADGGKTVALAELRTPVCSARFSLSGPPRVKVGTVASVVLTDGWGTGAVSGRLCVISPKRKKHCTTQRLAFGQRKLTVRFRATRRGSWTLQFTRAGVIETLRVGAGPAAGAQVKLPTVVATGDSTMLGVANFVAEELAGEVNVLERTKPGSGISAAGNPWLDYANSQVRLRPNLVVWSGGVAEGYPIGEVQCCGEPWQAAYEQRLRRVVEIYRGGGASVLLLTAPVPRDPRRAEIVAAATAAVLRVGADTPGVSVARIDRLVSPNGYSETIRYRGREVAIRSDDGVHLNRAGQVIEAEVVATRIRALLFPGGAPALLRRFATTSQRGG